MVVALDGMRMRGSISRGNLNFIEGSMNKHLCVNIRRERLKASAENLGFRNILHSTVRATQNIRHI